MRDLYRGAAVTLLPGEEDFGIVPVEAQACGSPVVALGRGGALETVLSRTKRASSWTSPRRPHSPTASAARWPGASTRPLIRRHAERFSRERFSDEMAALITADA